MFIIQQWLDFNLHILWCHSSYVLRCVKFNQPNDLLSFKTRTHKPYTLNYVWAIQSRLKLINRDLWHTLGTRETSITSIASPNINQSMAGRIRARLYTPFPSGNTNWTGRWAKYWVHALMEILCVTFSVIDGSYKSV